MARGRHRRLLVGDRRIGRRKRNRGAVGGHVPAHAHRDQLLHREPGRRRPDDGRPVRSVHVRCQLARRSLAVHCRHVPGRPLPADRLRLSQRLHPGWPLSGWPRPTYLDVTLVGLAAKTAVSVGGQD